MRDDDIAGGMVGKSERHVTLLQVWAQGVACGYLAKYQCKVFYFRYN